MLNLSLPTDLTTTFDLIHVFAWSFCSPAHIARKNESVTELKSNLTLAWVSRLHVGNANEGA